MFQYLDIDLVAKKEKVLSSKQEDLSLSGVFRINK